MASISQLPSEVAYQAETVFGTDPGSWAASGQTLHHDPAAVDLSGVGREMVENPRQVADVFEVPDKLHGLFGGSIPLSLPMHGTGTVTADTVQVVQTDLGEILEHMLGGDKRTYSSTCGAGNLTTTTFDPALTTDIDEGVWLAIADAGDANRLFFTQCASWDGTTWTSDVVLPFTPANGDVLHGVEANYIDSSALIDGGDTDTFAWLVQKGVVGSKECFLFTGAKAEFASLTLGRGTPAMLGINVHYAKHVGPDAQSEVTLALTPNNSAPAIVGGDADFWMEDDGTTTRTLHKVNELTLTPGVPVLPQDTITTHNANTPGKSGWTTGPSDTLMSLNLLEVTTAWWDDFQADTKQVARYQNTGSAGNAFGVHMSRAQIIETPKRGTAESLSSSMLSLRANRDSVNAAAGTAQLWQSKFVILRA